MRRGLLSSCGYLVLMLAASQAHAADVESTSAGSITLLTFEGGYLFNDSQRNLSFDPDDDKLGNLDSLRPGDDGGQFRFEIGQVFDSGWDYKVALGAILLGDDKTSASAPDAPGSSEAESSLVIEMIDLELGYHTDPGGVDLRLFGGVRALHARNEQRWDYNDGEKVGTYDDDVYAAGPRVGLGLTMPVSDQHQLALVGSVSGSVLFGDRSSRESGSDDRFSESETIWNVDAMAGVQIAVAEHAALTIGYKGQQFGDLTPGRSDVEKSGDYDSDGSKDVLVHGPFASLTLAIGATDAAGMDVAAMDVPELDAVMPWNGLYIGAIGGWGWTDGDAEFANDPTLNSNCPIASPPLGTIGCAVSLDPEGAFWGVVAGGNFVFDNGLMVGIEGDYSFAWLKDSGFGGSGFFGTDVELEIDEIASARARLGWAMGRFLPFVTAGWGFAHAERSISSPVAEGSDKNWHDGVTVGAGLEYAISERWSIKGEYRYYDLGEENYRVPTASGDGTDVDLTLQTVDFGVNLHF